MSSQSRRPVKRPFLVPLCSLLLIVSIADLGAASAKAATYNMCLCAANGGASGFATATNTVSGANPQGIFVFQNACGAAPPGGQPGVFANPREPGQRQCGSRRFRQHVVDRAPRLSRSPPPAATRASPTLSTTAGAQDSGPKALTAAPTTSSCRVQVWPGAALAASAGRPPPPSPPTCGHSTATAATGALS